MEQMEHLPPLDLEPNPDPTERSGAREAITPRNARVNLDIRPC